MLLEEKLKIPDQDRALPGRSVEIPLSEGNAVTGAPLRGPYPSETAQIVFGLGCFWGAEKIFWEMEGVYLTAVGYAGGLTKNPTYEEVCSGLTGHTEIVLVVYYPETVSLEALLKAFWEAHDPTQGMRQGNDIGTQYRSAIYAPNDGILQTCIESKDKYQNSLEDSGFGMITTEVKVDNLIYFAEQYHQQYLFKIPNGYCGLSSTGISYELTERP